MKTVVLFETDAYKSKSSRVFLGVFTNKLQAWIAFKKDVNNRKGITDNEKSEMLDIAMPHCDIIETELDQLQEL